MTHTVLHGDCLDTNSEERKVICLTEIEVVEFRKTLALLLVVHSPAPSPSMREYALETLKAEGATDADSAQAAILNRVIKMSEKLR